MDAINWVLGEMGVGHRVMNDYHMFGENFSGHREWKSMLGLWIARCEGRFLVPFASSAAF